MVEKSFLDVLKLLLPVGRLKRDSLERVSTYLNISQVKDFKYLLKQDKVRVVDAAMGSKRLGNATSYPVVEFTIEDPEVIDLVEDWNKSISWVASEALFREFSPKTDSITKLIAPNIIGMDVVKESVLLQLFASDKAHILLLGDPGTGKTEILSAVAELAPVSSFGLGSGTSGAGLTVVFQGQEMVKGLLPMAHKGLCCIDELNLMKETDRAGLLNAMEKGFVTYDKANKHVKVDADVKVLASANPKGDRFAGWMVDTIKKQLPFDPALLSRFHLVFLVKRPGVKSFVKIAKKIVKGKHKDLNPEDARFVKDYIEFSQSIKVKFDKKLEPIITKFVEGVKEDEDKFLIEISPRLVVGIVRLAKASARMNLREEVLEEDVRKVLRLVQDSLYLKEEKE